MLRMSAIAALVLCGQSAFAQQTEQIKGVKFGVGCVGPRQHANPAVSERVRLSDQELGFGARTERYLTERENPNRSSFARSAI